MPALLAAVALAMAAASTSPSYLALGDSTGVGVGARSGAGYPARLVALLGAEGRPLRLRNLCVSGARVADVLADQLPAALGAEADVVTLGIGINDVTRGTDPAAFADDYERLAAALARTGTPVVVVNVPDLSRSPLVQGEPTRQALARRIAAVNGAIAAAARRHGLVLVDLFESGRELETNSALLSEDRFHPSDAGYERWAALMAPAFRAALERAAHGGVGLPGGPALR